MKPQMQSSLLLPALTKPEKTSIFTVVVVHGLQKNMFAQITSDQGHETGNCESAPLCGNWQTRLLILPLRSPVTCGNILLMGDCHLCEYCTIVMCFDTKLRFLKFRKQMNRHGTLFDKTSLKRWFHCSFGPLSRETAYSWEIHTSQINLRITCTRVINIFLLAH